MKPQVFEWLGARSNGLLGVDDDMRARIVDFSFFWIYFEANLLGTRASVDVLKGLAEKLFAKHLTPEQSVQDCFEHFRARYVLDGQPTHHFEGLRCGREKSELFQLLLDPPSLHGRLVACLLVIYRFRNNLFHGPKWHAGFDDQAKNFEASNALLRTIAEKVDMDGSLYTSE
jgi:hypothetical protein